MKRKSPNYNTAALRGGAYNTAALKGGAYNTAALEGGAYNTAALEGGAYNTAALEGGAYNTAALEGGAYNTAALKGGRCYNKAAIKGGRCYNKAAIKGGRCYNKAALKGGAYNTAALEGGAYNTAALEGGECTCSSYNQAAMMGGAISNIDLNKIKKLINTIPQLINGVTNRKLKQDEVISLSNLCNEVIITANLQKVPESQFKMMMISAIKIWFLCTAQHLSNETASNIALKTVMGVPTASEVGKETLIKTHNPIETVTNSVDFMTRLAMNVADKIGVPEPTTKTLGVNIAQVLASLSTDMEDKISQGVQNIKDDMQTYTGILANSIDDARNRVQRTNIKTTSMLNKALTAINGDVSKNEEEKIEKPDEDDEKESENPSSGWFSWLWSKKKVGGGIPNKKSSGYNWILAGKLPVDREKWMKITGSGFGDILNALTESLKSWKPTQPQTPTQQTAFDFNRALIERNTIHPIRTPEDVDLALREEMFAGLREPIFNSIQTLQMLNPDTGANREELAKIYGDMQDDYARDPTRSSYEFFTGKDMKALDPVLTNKAEEQDQANKMSAIGRAISSDDKMLELAGEIQKQNTHYIPNKQSARALKLYGDRYTRLKNYYNELHQPKYAHRRLKLEKEHGIRRNSPDTQLTFNPEGMIGNINLNRTEQDALAEWAYGIQGRADEPYRRAGLQRTPPNLELFTSGFDPNSDLRALIYEYVRIGFANNPSLYATFSETPGTFKESPEYKLSEKAIDWLETLPNSPYTSLKDYKKLQKAFPNIENFPRHMLEDLARDLGVKDIDQLTWYAKTHDFNQPEIQEIIKKYNQQDLDNRILQSMIDHPYGYQLLNGLASAFADMNNPFYRQLRAKVTAMEQEAAWNRLIPLSAKNIIPYWSNGLRFTNIAHCYGNAVRFMESNQIGFAIFETIKPFINIILGSTISVLGAIFGRPVANKVRNILQRMFSFLTNLHRGYEQVVATTNNAANFELQMASNVASYIPGVSSIASRINKNSTLQPAHVSDITIPNDVVAPTVVVEQQAVPGYPNKTVAVAFNANDKEVKRQRAARILEENKKELEKMEEELNRE